MIHGVDRSLPAFLSLVQFSTHHGFLGSDAIKTLNHETVQKSSSAASRSGNSSLFLSSVIPEASIDAEAANFKEPSAWSIRSAHQMHPSQRIQHPVLRASV